ncbi:hypothetical protein [Neoroseomonas rubea]|uniref:hypothetical protein n=1 Tax=Neoroseomonas rubea TaxID=2748666 RepID=UPI0018E06070|nr:hypothetical protein [Roseomonas rubea]
MTDPVTAITHGMAEAAALDELTKAVARCPAAIRVIRSDEAISRIVAAAVLGQASAIDARARLAAAIAGHMVRK